jgi:hypothetical protein
VNPIEDVVDDVVGKLIFARKDVLLIVMIKLRINPFPVLFDHLIEVNQVPVLFCIASGRALELGVEVHLQEATYQKTTWPPCKQCPHRRDSHQCDS